MTMDHSLLSIALPKGPESGEVIRPSDGNVIAGMQNVAVLQVAKLPSTSGQIGNAKKLLSLTKAKKLLSFGGNIGKKLVIGKPTMKLASGNILDEDDSADAVNKRKKKPEKKTFIEQIRYEDSVMREALGLKNIPFDPYAPGMEPLRKVLEDPDGFKRLMEKGRAARANLEKYEEKQKLSEERERRLKEESELLHNLPTSWAQFNAGHWEFQKLRKLAGKITSKGRHNNAVSDLYRSNPKLNPVKAQPAEGNLKKEYPSHMVRYTKSRPSITYSINCEKFAYYYQTRRDVESEPDNFQLLMEFWSMRPRASVSKTREGEIMRTWYPKDWNLDNLGKDDSSVSIEWTPVMVTPATIEMVTRSTVKSRWDSEDEDNNDLELKILQENVSDIHHDFECNIQQECRAKIDNCIELNENNISPLNERDQHSKAKYCKKGHDKNIIPVETKYSSEGEFKLNISYLGEQKLNLQNDGAFDRPNEQGILNLEMRNISDEQIIDDQLNTIMYPNMLQNSVEKVFGVKQTNIAEEKECGEAYEDCLNREYEEFLLSLGSSKEEIKKQICGRQAKEIADHHPSTEIYDRHTKEMSSRHSKLIVDKLANEIFDMHSKDISDRSRNLKEASERNRKKNFDSLPLETADKKPIDSKYVLDNRHSKEIYFDDRHLSDRYLKDNFADILRPASIDDVQQVMNKAKKVSHHLNNVREIRDREHSKKKEKISKDDTTTKKERAWEEREDFVKDIIYPEKKRSFDKNVQEADCRKQKGKNDRRYDANRNNDSEKNLDKVEHKKQKSNYPLGDGKVAFPTTSLRVNSILTVISENLPLSDEAAECLETQQGQSYCSSENYRKTSMASDSQGSCSRMVVIDEIPMPAALPAQVTELPECSSKKSQDALNRVSQDILKVHSSLDKMVHKFLPNKETRELTETKSGGTSSCSNSHIKSSTDEKHVSLLSSESKTTNIDAVSTSIIDILSIPMPSNAVASGLTQKSVSEIGFPVESIDLPCLSVAHSKTTLQLILPETKKIMPIAFKLGARKQGPSLTKLPKVAVFEDQADEEIDRRPTSLLINEEDDKMDDRKNQTVKDENKHSENSNQHYENRQTFDDNKSVFVLSHHENRPFLEQQKFDVVDCKQEAQNTFKHNSLNSPVDKRTILRHHSPPRTSSQHHSSHEKKRKHSCSPVQSRRHPSTDYKKSRCLENISGTAKKLNARSCSPLSQLNLSSSPNTIKLSQSMSPVHVVSSKDYSISPKDEKRKSRSPHTSRRQSSSPKSKIHQSSSPQRRSQNRSRSPMHSRRRSTPHLNKQELESPSRSKYSPNSHAGVNQRSPSNYPGSRPRSQNTSHFGHDSSCDHSPSRSHESKTQDSHSPYCMEDSYMLSNAHFAHPDQHEYPSTQDQGCQYDYYSPIMDGNKRTQHSDYRWPETVRHDADSTISDSELAAARPSNLLGLVEVKMTGDSGSQSPIPSPPHRLSLDDRLHQEHGLRLREEMASPVLPKWQMYDNYSQQGHMNDKRFIQVGNMVQVLPQQTVQTGNVIQVVPADSQSIAGLSSIVASSTTKPGLFDETLAEVADITQVQTQLTETQELPLPLAQLLSALQQPLYGDAVQLPLEAELALREQARVARRERKEKRRREREVRRETRRRMKAQSLEAKEQQEEENLLREAMTEVPIIGSPVPDYEVADDDDDDEDDSKQKVLPQLPLREAEKGILLSPTYRFSGNYRPKHVVFADGVVPGEGSSASEGEEDEVPVPVQEEQKEELKGKKDEKKKVKKRVKKHKLRIRAIKEYIEGACGYPAPPSLENLPEGDAGQLYFGYTHYVLTAPGTAIVFTQQQPKNYGFGNIFVPPSPIQSIPSISGIFPPAVPSSRSSKYTLPIMPTATPRPLGQKHQ